MSERKCEWVFLPARDEPNERVCGAPIDGDSRYCAAHGEEMDYIHSLDDNWKEVETKVRKIKGENDDR